MDPEQLNNFLDYVKDIRGYLTALSVNFLGADERLAPYLHNLSLVGREEVDPQDFYEMLLELRKDLDILSMHNEKCYHEVLPCIKVLDELRSFF